MLKGAWPYQDTMIEPVSTKCPAIVAAGRVALPLFLQTSSAKLFGHASLSLVCLTRLTDSRLRASELIQETARL